MSQGRRTRRTSRDEGVNVSAGASDTLNTAIIHVEPSSSDEDGSGGEWSGSDSDYLSDADTERAQTKQIRSSSYKRPTTFLGKLRLSIVTLLLLPVRPIRILFGTLTPQATKLLKSCAPIAFVWTFILRIISLVQYYKSKINPRKLFALWIIKLLLTGIFVWIYSAGSEEKMMREDMEMERIEWQQTQLPPAQSNQHAPIQLTATIGTVTETERRQEHGKSLPFGGKVLSKRKKRRRTGDEQIGTTQNTLDMDAEIYFSRPLPRLSSASRSSSNQPLYSSLWCTGGPSNGGAIGDFRERACRMENVCWSLSSAPTMAALASGSATASTDIPALNAWTFHPSPSTANAPVVTQAGRMYTDFPKEFLSLGSKDPRGIVMDRNAARRKEGNNGAQAGGVGSGFMSTSFSPSTSATSSQQSSQSIPPSLYLAHDAGPWWTAKRVTDSPLKPEQFVGKDDILHVLYAPSFGALTPSSILTRDILPLWSLLYSFGLHSYFGTPQLKLLSPYGCEVLYASLKYDEKEQIVLDGEYTQLERSRIELCELLQSTLLSGVSPSHARETNGPIVLTGLEKYADQLKKGLDWTAPAVVGNTDASDAPSTSDHSICFPHLLLGLGRFGSAGSTSSNSEEQSIPGLQEFRYRYLHALGITPSPPPTRFQHSHKISLVTHPGPSARSTWPLVANWVEVKGFLGEAFTTASEGSNTAADDDSPEIELLDLHSLGWQGSLAHLQSTSILLCYGSPDDAAVAMFLPKGSPIIWLDLSGVQKAMEATITLSAERAKDKPVHYAEAVQRMEQMELSELGIPVMQPPSIDLASLSLLSHSGGDPLIQAEQDRFASLPFGSSMLSRLFRYIVASHEVEPSPNSDVTADGGLPPPTLQLRLDPRKIATIIEEASRFMEEQLIE